VDSGSFRRFYERNAPALRSYLRFSCRDRALADDLLQDSFLRMLRIELPDLEEPELKSYLYKTARSVMVDHFRKTVRDRRLTAKMAADETPVTDAPELPLDMQRALGELRERDQQLLWLAYVEGMSHREIAGVIEVNEKSVRVLLLRARERMGKVLADQGIGREEAL
jgi:RNA polymerase sigma-70 factor (ECF subfamily)